MSDGSAACSQELTPNKGAEQQGEGDADGEQQAADLGMLGQKEH